MTITQDIAVHVTDPSREDATPAEAAPVPGYKGWCPACYRDGIERLIKGFTIQRQDPSSEPVIVPPLDPGIALSLRAARDQILTQRAAWPSLATEHPKHAGAR